jgi:uroporphyrinogen decarboxylase
MPEQIEAELLAWGRQAARPNLIEMADSHAMNERERFRRSLTFASPDRFTLQPGWPRESTLVAWRRQGLPPDADWRDHLIEALDLPERPEFGMRSVEVRFGPVPWFDERVLANRDGHLIVQDRLGAVVEISDQYDVTYLRTARDFVTRTWHSFPVASRADWEQKMRPRFNPSDLARVPADFPAYAAALAQGDGIVRLDINGPFWQLRDWVGLENLCILMVEDPGFVAEMAEFWGAFVLRMLRRILPHVRPDYVQVSEDMAYKAHSMISPRMVRRFLLPVWQCWTAELAAAGCEVIAVDSDGYIAELLPLFIEAGFNCTFPVEVAAHNDIVAYRRQYGRRMAYVGGLDKRALAAGGETLRAEVLRVATPLLAEGGCILGCDHGVPPDISWPDFVAYTRLLAQLTGWLP